jgi:uncharacterized membrane protein (Fun14 family)
MESIVGVIAGFALLLSVSTILILIGVGLLIFAASDDAGRRY